MAITVTTKLPSGGAGGVAPLIASRKYNVVDILLDNSYPVGGYAMTPAQFGFTQDIDVVFTIPGLASNNILEARWDPANKKLMVFYPTGGTTAPTTVAVPIVKSGGSSASAVDATTPHITPGAAIECPNTTDLSAFTLRVFALGM